MSMPVLQLEIHRSIPQHYGARAGLITMIRTLGGVGLLVDAATMPRLLPLPGANPLPASGGRTVHHRLNRSSDPALNRALHAIMVTRWRTCTRTRAYVARRRAEGKNDNEIRRALKRYMARELYRTLNAATVSVTA